MTSILGKHSLDWLCRLSRNELFRFVEDHLYTRDMEVLIQYNQAVAYWRHINTKTTSPIDIVNSFPPWFIFTLSRRPATVVFGTWQEIMKSSDPKGYSTFITKNKKIFTRFIRDQLFLYKLSRSFRQILDLPTFSEQDTSIVLPELQRSILLGFATPTGILQRVAQFCEDKVIQIGISYLRNIEKLSSAISNSTTVDDVDRAISEFAETSHHLQSLPILQSPLDVDSLEVSSHNLEDYLDTDITNRIPMLLGREPRRLVTMAQVKTQEKLEMMEAYRDFPIWFRIRQYSLEAELTHKFPFMEFFICFDGNMFVIASRVKRQGDISWRQYSSYFEYFSDYNSSLSRMDQILMEQQEQGYQIINETR